LIHDLCRYYIEPYLSPLPSQLWLVSLSLSLALLLLLIFFAKLPFNESKAALVEGIKSFLAIQRSIPFSALVNELRLQNIIDFTGSQPVSLSLSAFSAESNQFHNSKTSAGKPNSGVQSTEGERPPRTAAGGEKW
jgi:hypothetical protein